MMDLSLSLTQTSIHFFVFISVCQTIIFSVKTYHLYALKMENLVKLSMLLSELIESECLTEFKMCVSLYPGCDNQSYCASAQQKYVGHLQYVYNIDTSLNTMQMQYYVIISNSVTQFKSLACCPFVILCRSFAIFIQH